MAISTYAELQTAVQNWIKRTDMAAMIPDFITLAEVRINRVFTPQGMEVEDELMTVAGSQYVALPAGFSTPAGLWLKAWLPRFALTQTLPVTLPVNTLSVGHPEYWAIDNGRIKFNVLAEKAWPFDFRYMKAFALSASNPTNYVLTNSPDLYLWGAVGEAAAYAMDPDLTALAEGKFGVAMREASNAENDIRAGAPLVTELHDAMSGGRFNIIRGY